jgi:hypothetical protein
LINSNGGTKRLNLVATEPSTSALGCRIDFGEADIWSGIGGLRLGDMAAFKTSDYESDMSDEAVDDEILGGWLDEEDPVEEEKPKPVVIEQPKIDVVRKSKYIVENVDLFYALCEVDDWGFVDFTDQMQEDIMRSLTVRSYAPGENIIVEGDGGNDCYIVSATEDTAHFAEVEVVTGNILEGTEVFLTRLQRGQYFGQKYFLTRRAVSAQCCSRDSLMRLSPYLNVACAH